MKPGTKTEEPQTEIATSQENPSETPENTHEIYKPEIPPLEKRILKILGRRDVYVNTKYTPVVREKFLAVLQETGNISLAADIVGLSRTRVYKEREKSKEFAKLWDEALEIATDYLEYGARRRSLDGVMKPVFYKGEVCGYTPEYSDKLMDTLLSAHRPGKYRPSVGDLPPGSEIIIAIRTGDGKEGKAIDVTPQEPEEEEALTE